MMKKEEGSIGSLPTKSQKAVPSLDWIVDPLLFWYRENARVLPWRIDIDPYRVWVSEIMLQQTRVEAVIPYFQRFMQAFPTIGHLAHADEESVLKQWEGLGYYSRARNLKKTAEIVCTQYDGRFPKEHKKVLALPGIGRYTAGAVCSIAFGQPYAAVDGNVLRVITRLQEIDRDIMEEKFRKEIGEQLEEIYPRDDCSHFTQSLMELGAVVCVPNGAPKCEECPLKSGCGAYRHNTWDKYPVKKDKAKRKIIHKTVLILECEGQIAVRKRADTGLLAGLWELPNVDEKMTIKQLKSWFENQEMEVVSIQKTKAVKHIFTHLEWHMQCYYVRCAKQYAQYQWVSKTQLVQDIALPTAFRKCL